MPIAIPTTIEARLGLWPERMKTWASPTITMKPNTMQANRIGCVEDAEGRTQHREERRQTHQPAYAKPAADPVGWSKSGVAQPS